MIAAMSDGAVTALAAVLAALLAALATAYAAVQSRRANHVQVDARVLEFLQKTVVALEERMERMRRELFEAQETGDKNHALYRRMATRVVELQDLLRRMKLAMEAAGIPIPAGAEELLQSTASLGGGNEPA